MTYMLVALAVPLIAWAAVSARAARYSVTIPIALLLAGLLFAGGDDPMVSIDLGSSQMRLLLETTLALILFTDATEIRLRTLRRSGYLPLRLLVIAFPLAVAAGYLAGIVLFPDASGWVLALVAAALAATDVSLVAPVVHDRRMPRHVRTAIRAESGFNDGLAAPLVLFFLAAALAGYDHRPGSLLADTLADLAIALAAGAAAGFGAGRLLRLARQRGWSAAQAAHLAYPAIAALAFGAAHALHGNGLVAAFVAGLAVRAADPGLPESHLQLGQDLVALLSAGVWFVFGSLVPGGVLGEGLGWRTFLYAGLSLTVVRMVPVAISLLGLRRPWRETLLLGWLGPCGLPSVIFGLIAIEELNGEPETFVTELIGTTVLLSVLAHGLTAGPVTSRGSGPSAVRTRLRSARPAP